MRKTKAKHKNIVNKIKTLFLGKSAKAKVKETDKIQKGKNIQSRLPQKQKHNFKIIKS